ncbi:MAG: type II and III secretion system protein [Planctomycetota bacterium]
MKRRSIDELYLDAVEASQDYRSLEPSAIDHSDFVTPHRQTIEGEPAVLRGPNIDDLSSAHHLDDEAQTETVSEKSRLAVDHRKLAAAIVDRWVLQQASQIPQQSTNDDLSSSRRSISSDVKSSPNPLTEVEVEEMLATMVRTAGFDDELASADAGARQSGSSAKGSEPPVKNPFEAELQKALPLATPGLNAEPLPSPSPLARPAPTTKFSSPSSSDESGLLNESFDQTDIREVLSILSSLAGRIVVVDDTVGGLVTAEIRDATWHDALEQVLAPLGYIAVDNNGRTVICPPDPEAPLFSMIATQATYQGQYQNVTEMVELLPQRFQSFIQISENRNLVSIDAPASLVDDITSRLAELDQPVPQVELEAIVCVVSPESDLRFGLDWNQVVNIDGVESLSAGISGLAIQGSVSKSGLKNLFSDFSITSAFIRSLAREGYLTIRASPRVTARDGEKAKISIAQETFFSLQPTSSNVLFRQDVQKVEAGIGLEITPKIRGDVISVQIERAEVSENLLSDVNLSAADSPFPRINRRVVSTNVDVRDRETIVIGGLVQQQQVEQHSRIPGLSRIPLLGRLFETQQSETQDVEVVIFISPHLVR